MFALLNTTCVCMGTLCHLILHVGEEDQVVALFIHLWQKLL